MTSSRRDFEDESYDESDYYHKFLRVFKNAVLRGEIDDDEMEIYDDEIEVYDDETRIGDDEIGIYDEIEIHDETVWDSGLSIARNKIIVHENCLLLVEAIAKQFPSSEFSVLFAGEWQNDAFVVFDEYYIPAQKVSTSSVDYTEDLLPLRKKGFTTVLHVHPSKCKSFSSADMEHINSHFPCSLLYCDGKITQATTLLIDPETEQRVITVLPEKNIEIFRPKLEIDKIEGLNRIEKQHYTKRYDLRTRLDMR